jgi:hypothetical protein
MDAHHTYIVQGVEGLGVLAGHVAGAHDCHAKRCHDSTSELQEIAEDASKVR